MIKLDLNPAPPVVRQFAYIALFGMPLLGFLALKLSVGFAWDHPVFLVCAGIGVLQLALHELGLPQPSKLLFVVLSVLFVPIGWLISNLLIGIVYYLVMTPIGLFFRLIGRDVLGKRPDPALKSYWHQRDANRPAASYFKLY